MLVMVASPCQVSGYVRLKSFIITVTVPHSPLVHSTRTDSGRVADTNVQTARRYPSQLRHETPNPKTFRIGKSHPRARNINQGLGSMMDSYISHFNSMWDFFDDQGHVIILSAVQ